MPATIETIFVKTTSILYTGFVEVTFVSTSKDRVQHKVQALSESREAWMKRESYTREGIDKSALITFSDVCFIFIRYNSDYKKIS